MLSTVMRTPVWTRLKWGQKPGVEVRQRLRNQSFKPHLLQVHLGNRDDCKYILVSVVGISVLERTKEIGVMKAVGAKNGHIWTIFLIESGLMGLVGGLVGTVLGLGISTVASTFIGRFFDLEMVVVTSPTLILATLFGSFALGAFAGLWPAWRASKLQVVDALRYE